MDNERLATFLGTTIVPAIVENVFQKDRGEDFQEFIMRFYNSKLYSLLSDSRTALWHLSPFLLAEMYKEELETGRITMPEEQS